MELISEVCSAAQSRRAEEIVAISKLGRNGIGAAPDLWKGWRLPGGGEKR